MVAMATTAAMAGVASVIDPRTGVCLLSPNKVPGYPSSVVGLACLDDSQASFIVDKFRSILTNPDREAAGKTAQDLIAETYLEESDSINILAGYPVCPNHPISLPRHYLSYPSRY